MTPAAGTFMRREIEEIADAVARLGQPAARAASRAVARRLRQLDPPALVTVARGSSDHAATYVKYAVELMLGRPVASVGPSVVSVFGARLRMDGLAAIAISQSGASEDIVQLSSSLRDGGAEVVVLTNTVDSPLAQAATAEVIDVAAGPERAVAATKSFVNSVVAGLWLVADWGEDAALARALDRLPAALARPDPDLGHIAAALRHADRTMVVGRGPGLGLAQEVGLKFLETCQIHASAYSGAEALHGPSALSADGYPVIALTTGTRGGMAQSLDTLASQGADVLVVPAQTGTGHDLVDPLLDLPSLYRVIEACARLRGQDPDKPAYLKKETKTR